MKRFANPLTKNRRRAESRPIQPQLTSLVDMMTILLLFLLKSFSVESELVTAASDLRLPSSTIQERATPTVNVVVGKHNLEVEGRPLVEIATLTAGAPDSLLINSLDTELRRLAAAEQGGFAAALTIQCDRTHDFSILKRVMYTCSQAGYDNFSLLVQREES